MKIDNRKLSIAMANDCITIKHLCEKAGLAESSFRKIRAGSRNPKPATVGKIAKALNVKVQDLLKDGD